MHRLDVAVRVPGVAGIIPQTSFLQPIGGTHEGAAQRYPLSWPAGWKRMLWAERKHDSPRGLSMG
jgi:hypothetical protein